MRVTSLGIGLQIGSLRRTPVGSITGLIFLKGESDAFPDSNWNDLILAVLVGWMKPVTDFHRAKRDQVGLFFMDGPFSVTLRRTEQRDVCECISYRAGRALGTPAYFQWKGFFESYISSVQQVVDFCEKKKWVNSDLEELREGLAALSPQHKQVRK